MGAQMQLMICSGHCPDPALSLLAHLVLIPQPEVRPHKSLSFELHDMIGGPSSKLHAQYGLHISHQPITLDFH